MCPLPLRRAPSFETGCDRNSTVQLCVSFDSEEAAGDNDRYRLEVHRERGAVVDFSREAGK